MGCQGSECYWEIVWVIKWWFKSLIILPEYSRDVQAQLFPTLAAVHNFILEWDPVEIAYIFPPSDDNINIIEDIGWLTTEYLRWAEKEEANVRCDQIMEDMWNDYQRILRERSMWIILLSLVTQYYEMQTLTFFQIQQQNKDMRKEYKVNRNHVIKQQALLCHQSCPPHTSCPSTVSSPTTYKVLADQEWYKLMLNFPCIIAPDR